MRLVAKSLEINQNTFVPEVHLTIAFPLEIQAELNGRLAPGIEVDVGNAYGQELVKMLKIALTDLTKKK